MEVHGEIIPVRSFADYQLYEKKLYIFGGIGPRNLDDFYVFTFGRSLLLSIDYYASKGTVSDAF